MNFPTVTLGIQRVYISGDNFKDTVNSVLDQMDTQTNFTVQLTTSDNRRDNPPRTNLKLLIDALTTDLYGMALWRLSADPYFQQKVLTAEPTAPCRLFGYQYMDLDDFKCKGLGFQSAPMNMQG